MKKPPFPILLAAFLPLSAPALDIIVDYTYDVNSFFDTQQKRDAMQAVADRYSRVITTSLLGVGAGGTAQTSAGWRIGFTHPGTGSSFEISTAASFAGDPLAGAGAAGAYGFSGLTANQWILYAGGRALGSAGVGGTGTGSNFTTTFDDEDGPMHRGIADNTPANSSNDLPRWGGSISFDSGRTWHFDLGTTAPGGASDFYSIAMHEVGHALGLSTAWNQWADDGAGAYTGANAIAAYNADNGTALSELALVSAGNPHWAEDTYDSLFFAAAQPNLVGTVGENAFQDLLMEPIADFGPGVQRFDLTNADVAALEDLGWTVVPEPSAVAAVLGLSALASVLIRRRKRARAVG